MSVAWLLFEGSGFVTDAYWRWGQAIVRHDDLPWLLYLMAAPVVLLIHCKARPAPSRDSPVSMRWVMTVLPVLRLVYLLSVSVALLVAGVARLVALTVPDTLHATAAALIGLAALLAGCATILLAVRHCPDFSETD